MRKSKLVLSAIVLLFALAVGCSAEADISAIEASEVVAKTQSALEKLSDKAVHTVETTTLTYPEGTDTVESERWYADSNCLYTGNQSDGITTTRLQYNDKVYTQISASEEWVQSGAKDSFLPFGVNEDTAEQFTESSLVSRKEENGEYCVVFSVLPQGGAQNYTKNETTLYFSTKWELLRIENQAEYSMESWADGTVTNVISHMVVEYQDTSAKEIKKQLEAVYKLVCE